MATAAEIAAVYKDAPSPDARVKVNTDLGHEKWRKLDDIADTDTIVLKEDGTAYYMGKAPGRPKKVEREPANENVRQVIAHKKDALSNDALFTTLHHDPDAGDVLAQVLLGMAEEAASLRFEREQAELEGKETSNISQRRVRALKAVGDNWLKRQEILGDKAIDLDGPAFATILVFFGETLRNTMLAMKMRPEEIDTIINRFAGTVDSGEWRAELESRLRR